MEDFDGQVPRSTFDTIEIEIARIGIPGAPPYCGLAVKSGHHPIAAWKTVRGFVAQAPRRACTTPIRNAPFLAFGR
jgi:hypothetical protein